MTTDTTFDVRNLKLGKAPAKTDPRTLRLEDFVSLPPPPAEFDRSGVVSNWGMLGNDAYGDCGPVGLAHAKMLLEAESGSPIFPAADQVVATYLKYTGGRDVGVVVLDMLNWFRKNDVPWLSVGGKPSKVLGFASINPRNSTFVRQAMANFRCILQGLWLPDTAKAQSGPGKVWSTVSLSGSGAPGTWGGHLVMNPGYTSQRQRVCTWGFIQEETEDFVFNYCDELYAVIFEDEDVPGFERGFYINALKGLGTYTGQDAPPQPAPTPNWPPTDAMLWAALERMHSEGKLRLDYRGQNVLGQAIANAVLTEGGPHQSDPEIWFGVTL